MSQWAVTEIEHSDWCQGCMTNAERAITTAIVTGSVGSRAESTDGNGYRHGARVVRAKVVIER